MLKPLAGALALALVAAPAIAAAPSDLAQASVRIGDLDPSSPADQMRLQKRMKVAALEVCGAHQDSVRAVKWAVERSACYKETLAQASATVQVALASR